MKKLLSILVVAIATFMMVSCFSETSNTTFEISGYPKSTYALEEVFDWTGLEIKIDGVSYEYSETLANNKFKVSGQTITFQNGSGKTTQATISAEPNCEKAGTKTVTINYGSLSANFQYTVLESYFANGDGNALTPYQISTVEQFHHAMDAENTTTTYYEIVNDLDFANENALPNTDAKNVYIDGNGYSLKNVNYSLTRAFVDSTFKNVNIYFNSKENDFSISKFGLIVEYTSGTCLFENVNTFGFAQLQYTHSSLFGTIDSGTATGVNGARSPITNNTKCAEITIKDCNNYATIYAFGIAAGLLTAGQISVINNSVESKQQYNVYNIINYKNYGTYVSQSCGFIAGSETYLASGLKYYIDASTKNYGTFANISLDASDFTGATSKTKGFAQSSENGVEKSIFFGKRNGWGTSLDIYNSNGSQSSYKKGLDFVLNYVYSYENQEQKYANSITDFNDKISMVDEKFKNSLSIKLSVTKTTDNKLKFTADNEDGLTYRLSLNTLATCYENNDDKVGKTYASKAVYTKDFTKLSDIKLTYIVTKDENNKVIFTDTQVSFKENNYYAYGVAIGSDLIKVTEGKDVIINIVAINASGDVVGYIAVDGDTF